MKYTSSVFERERDTGVISCSVTVIMELLKNTPEEWERDSLADGEREVGLLVANVNTLSGDSKHASSAKINRLLVSFYTTYLSL